MYIYTEREREREREREILFIYCVGVFLQSALYVFCRCGNGVLMPLPTRLRQTPNSWQTGLQEVYEGVAVWPAVAANGQAMRTSCNKHLNIPYFRSPNLNPSTPDSTYKQSPEWKSQNTVVVATLSDLMKSLRHHSLKHLGRTPKP